MLVGNDCGSFLVLRCCKVDSLIDDWSATEATQESRLASWEKVIILKIEIQFSVTYCRLFASARISCDSTLVNDPANRRELFRQVWSCFVKVTNALTPKQSCFFKKYLFRIISSQSRSAIHARGVAELETTLAGFRGTYVYRAAGI